MSNQLFDVSVYAARLSKAARLAADRGLGGLVFGTGADLQYLIGSTVSSHERLTALVVPTVGRPTLVLPAVERGDLPACAIGDLDADVVLWEDGEDAHEIVAKLLAGADTIGVGSSLTANHLLPIMELTGAQLVLATPALRELFMRKDEAEITQLREAGAAIDRVLERVPEWLVAGRTERDVAADIERQILAEGHSAVDFIIVGSGENGANPHHDFSDRVLRNGDIVVVDIGGTWGAGYHSDCTRVFAVGELRDDVAEAWSILRTAQEAAKAAVRPGVTAAHIDAVAREVITQAGYGEQFIHRTGHGIGLSTHEEPFIMAGNDLVLEPGMAFSIEPGIYVHGDFGLRLEDIVVVTSDGCKSMNNGSHELLCANGSTSAADVEGK
ncbi:M24 family metallopeptidase [Corynebacterium sp. H78]|uniref:M24 family metallopeptidase n=1 Tax=Corynebacterium sp. H78 TaxID=3133417 RepID=UPI0030B24BB2